MKKFYLTLLISLLAGCAPQNSRTNPSFPTASNTEAESFIFESVDKFGSKTNASNTYIDNGFKAYNDNKLAKALDNFNKAKLLDEHNPEVYHGLGSIIYDQGDNCRAMETMNKALSLDWGKRVYNRPGFLADLGMVTSLCAYTRGHERFGSQKSLVEASDHHFLQAESLHASAYLYDKWWQALYWRGDYQGAWEKVFRMRELGEEPHPILLKQLKEKFPNPSH